MVVPTSVTNYSRSSTELLEFAIFAVCVAGKNADQTAKKVNALWSDQNFRSTLRNQWEFPPKNDADYQTCLDVLRTSLETHKIGQYDRLTRVIFWLNQNSEALSSVLFNQLVDIKGIGPKTAAFFLLHSRVIFDIAVIDTHIIKYMATKGIEMKITSNVSKYLKNAYLVKAAILSDFPHNTLAEADLHLWTKFSGRTSTQLTFLDSLNDLNGKAA